MTNIDPMYRIIFLLAISMANSCSAKSHEETGIRSTSESSEALKSDTKSEPEKISPEVIISYAHDGCSFQYSPIDFCDEHHMNIYREAISRHKINFSNRYILLSIMEREVYHQRSLVILDPSTGAVYPFPFDSYSGPMKKDGRIASDGNLKFDLQANEVCIDGSLKVQREIKNGSFCFTFDSGEFGGHKTQYMYKK
ncbi:hypothetical protein [Xanthomonas massiliensis]|uniref:hypothetical protein n=1 Tax=Xanthomonas massiliensis TaxID=1720302 RepID=UPI0011C9CF1A|nr:hypothetical protein [Xanthomonas massiliensis]